MRDLMQALKGLPHLKRAIEVAAVQQHQLLLIAEDLTLPDVDLLVRPITDHFGVDTYTSLPCSCGGFGSTEHECVCTPAEIVRFRRNHLYVFSPCMQVTVVQVKWETFSSERVGETLAAVEERVALARTHVDDVPRTLCAAGTSLMKAAYRQLSMTQVGYAFVIEVAASIAALANRKEIHAAHLAEAIQYQLKP
jgi:predicted ATPase with chaperone activity